MRKKRKISVIIPLYNHAKFIEEAIVSVLKQTIDIDEIIVVDDGSTDNSIEVVRKYTNIILITKKHSGVIESVNMGLNMASGDYISFLDADDKWLANKTELQLTLLEKNPDVDMVYGNCMRFKTEETPYGFKDTEIDIMPGVCRGGGLFRKKAFDEIKLYNNDNSVHCFIDWFARAKEANMKSLIHPEIVFYRRIHDSNQGIREKDFQRQQYFNTLKAKIDRLRTNK
jgi:glycosyltransferase involved in cell wall biosynthesis